MLLRKQQREQPLDEQIMESAFVMHPNDEENSMENDLQALSGCIEELVDEQKACVTAFYLKKESYQQIAEQLKLELKKVKSYIQNGKRNLKICLEGKNVKR